MSTHDQCLGSMPEGNISSTLYKHDGAYVYQVNNTVSGTMIKCNYTQVNEDMQTRITMNMELHAYYGTDLKQRHTRN